MACAALLASAPRGARAQESTPAPISLPNFAHPRTDMGITWGLARGTRSEHGSRDDALALVRLQIEGSVFAQQRLYLGVTYQYAAALPPDGGFRFVDVAGEGSAAQGGPTAHAFSNVEPHVRGVFPISEGLAYGFGLGVAFPTATFDRNSAVQSAMVAATSLEPTDYVHFLPGRVTLRPAGDLRIDRSIFALQVRHGFDVIIDGAGVDPVRSAGRVLIHAGVRPTPSLEVALEGTHQYFFFTDDPAPPPAAGLSPEEQTAAQRRAAAIERYRISDDRRAAVTLGPTVRYSLPEVDLGVGIATNVFSPLSPALDSFVAIRFSVLGHFR